MIDSLVTSLKSFTSRGQLSEAFKVFSIVQSQSHGSKNHTVIAQCLSYLLASCAELRSLEPGKQLHSHLVVSGFERNPGLVPKLVTFYTSFNLLPEARVITENSEVIHSLPWNLLIFSYVKNRLFDEALFAYKEMVSRGIRPANFTYPAVLKACGENMDVEFGREVHKSIEASSEPWSLFVHNALVAMYLRFGLVDIARELFEKMPERDVVSCNTIISAYVSKGMWKEAFEIFERMLKDGMEIRTLTWNTIAGGFLRTGDFTKAVQLISRMRASNVPLDPITLVTGLGACSHMGAIKLGKQIHGFAIQHGFDENSNLKNALINMYFRCEELGHACTVFRLIENKTTVSWNSMISGYTHMGRAEEALFLFSEMLFSGIEPTYVTIASILRLSARVANLQHGKEFHSYILKRPELVDHSLLWNAIVDVYARSGKISLSKRVFDSLTDKDVVAYTSMISGYGVQGEGQKALELFVEMVEREIKPDHITMVAILSACSHSGFVKQGEFLFEKMEGEFGLKPRSEHYACIVDLYGRAGMINDAKDIIAKMPYAPTPRMWATLIGACRIHGNLEIGELAAERLLKMSPKNPGYYVLIANMYASVGRWDKLAMVRALMIDLGVTKAPGWAWVDIGNGFSSFLVGDMSNPLSDEIYQLLDGLSELMKDEGYVTYVEAEDVFED